MGSKEGGTVEQRGIDTGKAPDPFRSGPFWAGAQAIERRRARHRLAVIDGILDPQSNGFGSIAHRFVERVASREASRKIRNHNAERLGYARTSTTDQAAGLAAQVRDLEAQGCDRVFTEQVSGTVTVRPELEAAIDYLRRGDALVVCKPDRLARSTADLLAFVGRIKAKGCELVILSMGGQTLDTRSPTSKLMLSMLAAVAEFERDLMLERQREGIAKAKAEGRYLERKSTARSQAEEVQKLAAEGGSPTEIAKRLGIGRTSVYRCLGKVAA